MYDATVELDVVVLFSRYLYLAALGLLTMTRTYTSSVCIGGGKYYYTRIGLMSLRTLQMVNWGRDIGWPRLVLMEIRIGWMMEGKRRKKLSDLGKDYLQQSLLGERGLEMPAKKK